MYNCMHIIWFCIHTPWQNAQAALNHNTFYWSRLNSHKASLKKEIGQIRKRFSWKKVQRENTDRARKCAMEMDVHLLWSSVRSLLHGLLLILCSYNIYQSLCCLLCHTRHRNHCFFPSVSHFLSVILPQQQISCWPRLRAAGTGLSGAGIDPAPSWGLPFISQP